MTDDARRRAFGCWHKLPCTDPICARVADAVTEAVKERVGRIENLCGLLTRKDAEIAQQAEEIARLNSEIEIHAETVIGLQAEVVRLRAVLETANKMRAVLRLLHDYCEMTEARRKEVVAAMNAYDEALRGG